MAKTPVTPKEDDPPVSESNEPISLVEPSDSFNTPEDFLRQFKIQNSAPVEPPPPPAPTARQLSQIEEEMAAGARRVKFFEEQQKNRPKVEMSASEKSAQGSSTPVFRPDDFVPGMR